MWPIGRRSPAPRAALSRCRGCALAGTAYARLPRSSRHSRIPARARLNALHSGILTVRLADSRVRVLNIHPTANTDGDWSEHNRFRQLQRDQLTALAQAVTADSSPTVVCGDFNVARASTLHRELRRHPAYAMRSTASAHPPSMPSTYHQAATTLHRLHPRHRGDRVDDTALLLTDQRPLPSGPTTCQTTSASWPDSTSPTRPEAGSGDSGEHPDSRQAKRRHPQTASNHTRQAKRRHPHNGEQPQPPSEATAPPQRRATTAAERSDGAGGAGGGAPARGKRSAAAQHDEGEALRAFRGHTSPIAFVELRGFEPLASSLRTKRATNCATAPSWSPVAWRPRNSNTAMVAG